MVNVRKNMGFLTEELLGQYERYLKEEERGRTTVEKYLRDVRKFRDYLGAEGGAEFDKEMVLEYKQYLKKRYRTTSANSMLAAVNSFLEYIERGDCRVKLLRIQRVQFSEKERELTEKDYEKLVRAAQRKEDIRMSMLLRIIGSTGIRISEFQLITVEALKTDRADIYNKGKSRIALLPVELVRVLKKYCGKMGIRSGSIFITRNGKLTDRSNINKRMKQLGREAGVDTSKVFPHNFRHLLARVFYSIEKNVMRLMDLLGHSSISMTRIYAMGTEEQPRRQMSRIRMVFG